MKRPNTLKIKPIKQPVKGTPASRLTTGNGQKGGGNLSKFE